eukprot:gnl/TRDRNA2_/TRDRNA2_35823_c0_seq1.p1 gnl/TRDRNA2_/TRDRNA2_35823_c0~~gnl/TRDRNA2_/TRDRNA2_35823_c0_seq1.p1  ORF type:complete len:578 (+),score=85.17 gnl/TRDRNA2_/TRDRNA2_35823_c0_seq1:77-1735(+)
MANSRSPASASNLSWGPMFSEDPMEALTQPSSLEDGCPSMLSRHFAAMQDFENPEKRMDASLSDLVDLSLRSLHVVSQTHKPSSQALLEGLPPAHRQETLVWLLQAFDVMHFHDSLLFDTALLLDRYYACLPREEGPGAAQRKILAAVCTALKTGCLMDTPHSLRQVITHLGRDQVPFDEVLVAELAMLRKLRFHVGTPTARDFLEALGARQQSRSVGTHRGSNSCLHLAEFLLQLTLKDAPFFYRHPHAILAASCLALALHTTRAPMAAYVALMEDLVLYCPDIAAPHGPLVQCTSSLHLLWVRSIASSEQNSYTRTLCAKFGRENFDSVSNLAPLAMPPSSIPPVHFWMPPSQPQDEIEEAIAFVRQNINGEDTLAGRTLLEQNSDLNKEAPWATTLAQRLRGLADSSAKVRGVLLRHGWGGGQFRRLPDRDVLLRDLMRSKGTRENGKASSASTPAGRTTQGKENVAPMASPSGGQAVARFEPQNRNAPGATAGANSGSRTLTSSTGTARTPSATSSAQPAVDQRRRRAASWCGQRSSSTSRAIGGRSP